MEVILQIQVHHHKDWKSKLELHRMVGGFTSCFILREQHILMVSSAWTCSSSFTIISAYFLAVLISIPNALIGYVLFTGSSGGAFISAQLGYELINDARL
jgi:hypothetical protein